MLYLKKVFYLVGGYLKIRTFNDFAKNIKNALLHLESHSCCVRSVFRKFVKPELNVVDFHLTVGVLFFVIDLLKRRSQDFFIPRSNLHQISRIQTDFDFRCPEHKNLDIINHNWSIANFQDTRAKKAATSEFGYLDIQIRGQFALPLNPSLHYKLTF